MMQALSCRIALSASMLLIAVGAGRAARAEPRSYRPVASAGQAASVRVDLPYTFGVHHLEAGEVKGEVRVDWTGPVVATGRLTIPIASLHGGGDTFNCHMREALGLDYTKSAFPRDHVCSGGTLPASGKDSIAFPEISFEIRAVTLSGGAARPVKGQTVRAAVVGRWTIHGVSHDDAFDLSLTVVETDGPPRSIRVEGARKLRLSAYGIEVKRALVIKAGDEATVNLSLLLDARR